LRDDQPLLRLTIMPNARNGLTVPSQILIDKITTFPAIKIGEKIGEASVEEMQRVNLSLTVFLGLS
jgi:mRNA interferase MazF